MRLEAWRVVSGKGRVVPVVPTVPGIRRRGSLSPTSHKSPRREPGDERQTDGGDPIADAPGLYERIKAPGVSRGISVKRTGDPIADAPGLYERIKAPGVSRGISFATRLAVRFPADDVEQGLSSDHVSIREGASNLGNVGP